MGLDLGERWRTLDVTYKPFPVCAILQGPVEHAIALAREHDLAPHDIAAVRLHLPPSEAAYPGLDASGPFPDVGATLMSAQFCLAVALSRRAFRGTDLLRLSDPVLLPLIGRSRVIPDATLAAGSFVMEIAHADGRTLRQIDKTAGEPFNWNRDEVMENLRAMADELPLGAGGIARLADAVLNAERHSARDIVSACVVPAETLRIGVLVRPHLDLRSLSCLTSRCLPSTSWMNVAIDGAKLRSPGSPEIARARPSPSTTNRIRTSSQPATPRAGADLGRNARNLQAGAEIAVEARATMSRSQRCAVSWS